MVSTKLDTIYMYVKSVHLHTGSKLNVVKISLTGQKFVFMLHLSSPLTYVGKVHYFYGWVFNPNFHVDLQLILANISSGKEKFFTQYEIIFSSVRVR